MIKLSDLSQQAAGDSVIIRRFPFVVGTDPAADLRCNAVGVQEKHLCLDLRIGDGVYASPIEGAEVEVDGAATTVPVRLKNGSQIRVGTVSLLATIVDPTIQDYRYRETLTWVGLIALVVLELWLLFALNG